MRNTAVRTVLVSMLIAVCAPVDALAQDPSRLYEKALTAFENEKMENAVVALKSALDGDPGLLPAYVLLARVYLRIQEPAAAEDALKRARRLGGDPSIVWPLRAEAMLAQRKHEELIALAPRGGLNEDAQSKVLVLKGLAQVELRKFAEAEVTFGRAAALTPAAPDPLVAHAVAALRQGKLLAAEARAIKASRVAPDDADAWNVLGDVRHMQGNLAEALTAYGSALRLEAAHRDARVSRAGLLLDLGKLDEAAVDIAYLRDKYPLDPRPAYLLAVQLTGQKRNEEAREALSRASALLTELGTHTLRESTQLSLLAGVAGFELGDYEQAQGHLQTYIDKYPDQPGPLRLLGTVLLRNGRPAEAILALERSLEKAPDDARTLASLASAYTQTDRHDIATRYLEKAVALSGGAPKLRAHLALSRIGSGFTRQGERELTALFEENPKKRSGVGLTLATLLFNNGRFAEAMSVAERVLEAEPDNLTVLNLLASTQLRAGRLDEARASYEKALALDADFLPAKVNLGKLAAMGGRHAEARSIYLEVLAKRPDNVPTMIALAQAEQALGGSEESLRWLQKARSTAPDSIAAGLALVNQQLVMGEPRDAEQTAQEMANAAPENMDVLEAVARTHIAQDRRDVASDIYRRMSRIAGFDTGKMLRIARLQVALGEPVEAIFSLTKGLRTDPGHRDSRLLLVALQIRTGKLEEALERVTALLEDEPGLAEAHRLAGAVQQAIGNLPEAVARLSSAFELEPNTRHVLALLGARVAAGQESDADELLARWLAEHPEDTVARLALAQRDLAGGRLDAARKSYEQVLKLNPFSATALNNLAYVLDKQKAPGAMEYAERAVKLTPDDPAVLDTLGWMLVRRGDISQGLSYLRDAQSRAAGNPEIRYHIATALVALDRTEEAKREFQRALEISQQFEGAADARKALDRLSK